MCCGIDNGTGVPAIDSGASSFLDTTASSASTQAASAHHTAGRINTSINTTITITHPLMTTTGGVVPVFEGTVATRNFAVDVSNGSFAITISGTTAIRTRWYITRF